MAGCAIGALPLVLSPAGAQVAPNTPISEPSPQAAPVTGSAPATGEATPSTVENGGLQEIVVTAQKRSENLQNVPIAITALSSKQLAVAQISNTSDLKAVTPGLAFNTALGGFGQPRIRGIGTTTTGPGIENPVATYVDGVYIGSAAGTLFSLNDVEQVAVLKGPQGTLFGRNATGGLIQVSTRAPSQTPTADASITYGNYDTVNSSAYVSGGLTDTLAASVAGIYENQQDGYGKNLYNGKDVQKHRDYAGRGKLQWKPDSDTKFTLSGDYSYLQGADPAIRPINGTLLGVPSPGGERDIDQNIQPYLKTKTWGVSLTGQHDFAGVQLLSITAYRDSFLHAIIDGDQTPVSLVGVDQTQKDRQFSQEVQLLSTSPGPFKWVVGAYYFWSQGRYDPLQTTITQPFGTIVATIDSKQTLNSYAAFAQGTYDFGASTHLTVGLRYTIDDRAIDASSDTVTPFGPDLESTAASKSFKKLTWRLSLDHRFSPNLLGYISYNRGFKSGSFVPQEIPAETLKPETLDAFEAGLKSDLFDHRVRLNVAAYYYDYKNIQINEILDGVLYPFDGKGARSYGIDADLTARVTEHLTVMAGAGWIHDRYKSFPDGYTTEPIIDPATFQFTVLSPYNSTGNRLQDTPDWTANIGATYDIGPITLAASYYFNNGYYVDPGNRVREPHYNLADASVTWTSADKHLSVKVWGKNLTNALYSEQLDATSTGDNRVAAPPRTYGVTAGFHF
jgi:iron complex outermembrane receptor protein